MAHYNWEQRLDTGIDTFDLHHQRITEYANRLFDAIKYNDKASIGTVLDLLIEYSISVFSYEDALMEQVGYPMATEHKAVHRNFTSTILNYRERHLRGEDVGRRLLSDLRVWITNHVQRDDADYVPYVRRQFSTGWLKRLFGRRCA